MYIDNYKDMMKRTYGDFESITEEKELGEVCGLKVSKHSHYQY